MFSVTKSQIATLPFDFVAAVGDHLAALQAFRDKPVGDPPIAIHPWVDQAIRLDGHVYGVSYRVIDDTPSLEARKTVLLGQVRQAHAAAEAAVLSPGRRALLGFEAGAALRKPVGARTAADEAVLEQARAVNEKSAANGRHAAVLAVEVEELTVETIDSWTMSDFPHAG